MNIFQTFQTTCQAYPQKVCIKFKKGEGYDSLTYREFFDKVLVMRSALVHSGIKPGQRVAILLGNSPLWPIAFFAIVSIQAVAVPLDVQLSPEDIKAILLHSESRFLLTEEKFGVSLAEILPQDLSSRVFLMDRQDWGHHNPETPGLKERGIFPPERLAALFYTSGTTHEQKAVMLAHKNLLSNFYAIQKLNIISSADVILCLLPLHHAYPFMVACLVPFLEGSTVCYLQSMVHHELFGCLKANQATMLIGVPQLFNLIERSIRERMKKYGFLAGWTTERLIDVCLGLSKLSGRNVTKAVLKNLHETFGEHLRFMVSGGAKLDASVARSFTRWGFKIIEGYGLTETSPVVALNPANAAKFDSVGSLLSGVEVKIIHTGEDASGEICVRGDNVMLGYYRAKHLTKKVFLDRWFLTGDLGFLDRQGYLHISGRINELIVLPSGKKINPESIEAHYLKSPFIKEICVLHSKAGGDNSGHLVAVIVPDEDALRQKGYVNIHFKIHWELDQYSGQLPPYQRLKGFVVTRESLPRTRLGKLIRYKIGEKYNAGAYRQEEETRPVKENLSLFEETALKYLSRILKKEVHLDDHLELDLGLDSLGRIELLSSLQELITVGIDDSLALEMFSARTVRDIITRARQALPESAFVGFLKREDTVFWPQILKDSPSAQMLAKVKLNFDAFDRFVSYIEIFIFKFLFRVIFSVRVRGKSSIPADGPFVMTPNHVSYLDPFYILCALPPGLIMKTYFVGFGSIFNHPLVSWAVRFHRLIPIDANLDLAQALKVCRYVLGQGKILVYFPEGQRSIDGGIKEFRKGIGILLKESQGRVVPVYLEGAYKAWPRTRAFPLPAEVTVKVGKPVFVNEFGSFHGKDEYTEIANSLQKKVVELERS